MANSTTIYPQPNTPVSTSYPRTISYTAGNNEVVELNHCNYTVSTRLVESARGRIKRVYRFAFTFIISTDGMTNYTSVVNAVERVLNQKAGTLIIRDAGIEVYRCGPAGGITVNIPKFSIDSVMRPTILADIEWGPLPVSVSFQPLGVGAYGEWVVDVTTASEEAFIVGDTVVLGVDSEITYSIDKNHYTTRTVVGKVYCANWGRNASTPFGKAPLSYADQLNIRLAILGTAQAGYTKYFMDPITIPPNFERLKEDFSVDATENVLGFMIVDREKYRMMPQYITDAACSITVTSASASQVSYCTHVISGFCEAPRDVDKGRVLQACMEQIQDALGPLLFRSANNLKAFVSSHTFSNDAYTNRITYQVTAITPFGDFNFFNSLGIGNFRSAVFLPQGTGGTAQLSGSGYRRPGGTGSRPNPVIGAGTPPPDKEISATDATTEQLRQAIRDSQENSKFPYDKTVPTPSVVGQHIETHVRETTETTLAVPSTVGAEAVPYRRTEPTYKVTVGATIISIREVDSSETGYLTRVAFLCANIPGLTYVDGETTALEFIHSPMGTVMLQRYQTIIRFRVSGQLRKFILDHGGMQAFINVIESSFWDSEADLKTKLQAFLSTGAPTSLGG